MRPPSAMLLVLSAIAASGQPNTLTPTEKKAGWVLLFDGSSMNGWSDPRRLNPPGDAWTIEDGCLKAVAKSRITEDLFSQQTFRDFELAWEWRISPAGNSGVKYRIQDHFFVLPRDVANHERFEAQVERTLANPVKARPERGQDYVVGFEYQMTDNGQNSDAQSSPKHSAGALYDMVGPSTDATRPVSEFNQSRIVLRGNHVEHWMNAVKVVDASLNAPEAQAGIKSRWAVAPGMARLLLEQPKHDCPISLQNHGNDCWFRSIKIRELR